MICYYDGDIKREGFRFIWGDTICIDFCEENYPFENYISNIIKYINKNHIRKLFINSMLSAKIDLAFLYLLKYVEDIQISADCINLDPVISIKPKVLRLQLQNYPVDFSDLHENLDTLDLYNLKIKSKIKAQLNDSLLKCKKLKRLGVSNFNQTDCNVIRQLSSLNELSMAYENIKHIDLHWINLLDKLKTLAFQGVNFISFDWIGSHSIMDLKVVESNIETLSGVKNLINLKQITLSHCKKLMDIQELSNCSNLFKLEIDSCKGIKDFECLRKLKNLEALVISNCGNIPSIKFIDDMPKLRFFSFVDTNVVDGDLTPCMRLDYAGTMNKRHYNIKAEDLPRKSRCNFRDL